jgi:hypothetical protein
MSKQIEWKTDKHGRHHTLAITDYVWAKLWKVSIDDRDHRYSAHILTVARYDQEFTSLDDAKAWVEHALQSELSTALGLMRLGCGR